MKILVLNCGSSSVKSQLIETTPEMIAGNRDRQLARVSVENIGGQEAVLHCEILDRSPVKDRKNIPGHREAVETAVQALLEHLGDVVHGKEEIEGVGHRIVHGGERFTESALIDDAVVKEIENSSELAPLHNPENLKGFYAARAVLPHARHVAVFDTSFHQTLPPYAYIYGLPYDLYTRYKIRRYGFHGTSHRYVSYRFAELHNGGPGDYNLITCHLGNGCSMSAIDRGKSVDTSMGFTPLEGLLMGTRSGDVDPAAVLYFMEKESLTAQEAGQLLNHNSGLYGVSGVGNDMRAVLEQGRQGHERAQLAVEIFCYRVRKYIGAYLAVLNGCDGIIFTGGIGENGPPIRARICDGLSALGIQTDSHRNDEAIGVEKNIAVEGARPEVWVIPTNEELMIARDTLRCILQNRAQPRAI